MMSGSSVANKKNEKNERELERSSWLSSLNTWNLQMCLPLDAKIKIHWRKGSQFKEEGWDMGIKHIEKKLESEGTR